MWMHWCLVSPTHHVTELIHQKPDCLKLYGATHLPCPQRPLSAVQQCVSAGRVLLAGKPVILLLLLLLLQVL